MIPSSQLVLEATLFPFDLRPIFVVIGSGVSGFYISVAIYLKAFAEYRSESAWYPEWVFLMMGFGLILTLHGNIVVPYSDVTTLGGILVVMFIGILGVEYLRFILPDESARLREIMDEDEDGDEGSGGEP